MTALFAIVAKLWPALLGAIVAAGGLLAGWARTKQAQTTEARADQKVAEADVKLAQIERTEAEANAGAAQAGADAAQQRAEVEERTSAMTNSEVQNELDKWRR